MKVQAAVKEETRKIALGTLALSAGMLLIFLCLGKLNSTVVLGTALGAAAAIGNFFWMALSVQKAAEKMNGVSLPPEDEAEETDETKKDEKKELSPEAKNARNGMQLSYTIRMLLLVGVALLAIKVPAFSPVAAIIALFFPRIVIFILGFIMRKEDKAS